MTTITNNELTDDVLEYVLAVVEDRYENRKSNAGEDDRIILALRELQERRKSFRWISIDEELPEDESTVIVKNIDGVQWVADFSDDCFYPDEFPVYKMGGDEVTHWMRFPE
ncbi:DUF551 domain-containing protein [Salmonella enterica subsp. enterica serovar Bredeney]|uniref:DUF551 domain-containing protein n=1 Tax=Salmonella enterica TaxID=28901 RepID=UPI003132B185